MKVTLRGGTAVPLAAGQNFPTGALAVDATSIYWASKGGACANDGGTCATNGTVMKLTPK